MGQARFIYNSSIALSCIFLMLASIACTGWFFYSWLGGVPGIVGACVGCSVQLMAYGFSGIIVHQPNGLLRIVLFVLIGSALSLSVLSSYATLSGYFSALQNEQQAIAESAAQKNRAKAAALAQRLRLLDSMSRDVSIASEAADQGLSEKYRTQASQFLTTNAATRGEIEAQIEKLENMALSPLETEIPQAQGSPIDGLSSVMGGQHMAIIILCAWLAIMFDALPIAGITLLETRSPKKAKTGTDVTVTEMEAVFVESLTDESTVPPRLGNESTAEAATYESDIRIITNICSADIELSKAFFVSLLDLNVKYESDWYIQLCSQQDEEIEFGLIQRDHELVPIEYQNQTNGMYMTFLVPDVNETYERALSLGMDILQEPQDEFYGQRRFLVREPNGCLVDICSPSAEV